MLFERIYIAGAFLAGRILIAANPATDPLAHCSARSQYPEVEECILRSFGCDHNWFFFCKGQLFYK
jgi:hypothetical protein